MVLAQMIADSTDLMTECLVATMNLDAKDTAKMKFLAYKASLSFLKCAGNTDQSLREEIQMTVDHCVASMTTDSVVGAIIKSLECRKTVLELSNRLGLTNDPDFRTAMRADEERIEIFLVAIFSSIEQKTVLGLKGDSAQDFLDVVQEMLDRGFLMKQEHTRMAFRIIRKLSESCDLLPTSLFVVGVTGRGEYPTCGGGFADIFLALYDNRPVALKRMRHFVRGSNLTRIRLKFCREALLWKDLHHPNILPFLGIDRDSFGPSFFCMVSPWMKHGTVINYLETHGHANVDKLLYEIVQGLEYLHSHNIVHGDLRGTNILIQEDGSACLADFGLSSFSDATVAMSTTRAGSPCWMAPELLAPEHFGFNFARTPATDVYAFGCVCFELYTGRPPFSTLPEPAILMKVLNSERPDRPSGPPVMSDMLWQHVTEFLAQSPTTRPSTPLVVQNMVWPRPAPRPSTPSGRLVACENLLGSTFETNESLSSSADHTAQASGRGEASQLATESIPSFHEINGELLTLRNPNQVLTGHFSKTAKPALVVKASLKAVAAA
ncbi:kinase-like domain-containing protein [Mycena galopus ATCC 62051]|nr:kinase-like domain-containing protein [Mycena galopus ATCC 62051]